MNAFLNWVARQVYVHSSFVSFTFVVFFFLGCYTTVSGMVALCDYLSFRHGLTVIGFLIVILIMAVCSMIYTTLYERGEKSFTTNAA